jgi:hypothetical protein
MSTTAEISEPASELKRLIADLPGSGLLAFVFGVGWWVAHLKGVTTPLFRGPADRRWWHVELGADAASFTMDVRQPRRVQGRSGQTPAPGCVNHRGHWVTRADSNGDSQRLASAGGSTAQRLHIICEHGLRQA